MRYWDSSAIVPLVLQQPTSSRLRALLRDDPQIITWILSDVEVLSAVCRLLREGDLSREDATSAASALEVLWQGLTVVAAVDAAKMRARRLLSTHVLRAADALQLGAAILAAYDAPSGWEFVCLDERLRVAAAAEGFRVIP